MIRRPPRSTLSSSSAASDVYKRQNENRALFINVIKMKYSWLKKIPIMCYHILQGGIEMKRFKIIIINIIKDMSRAGERFPLTVLSLFGAAGILCYMISLREMPGLLIQQVMFTLIVGAFLGMAAQFAAERFDLLSKNLPVVHGFSLLLTAGYFFILWPAPEINAEIGIRTFVAILACLLY